MLLPYIRQCLLACCPPLTKRGRIGSDQCSLSQRNVQNESSSDYLMTNFYPDCPMTEAIKFATCQPAINYTGSRQLGLGGCNVDENSILHISDMTRDKCRVSLWQRPFATVPYLGRGRSDHLTESNLRKGEEGATSASSKSKYPDSEVSYLRYTNTPLLPQLDNDIKNSSRHIEEDAAKGWIRGGLPSREYDKRLEFASSAEPGSIRYGRKSAPWCGDSQATSAELKTRYYTQREKNEERNRIHRYSSYT